MKFLMNIIVVILLISMFSGCVETDLSNEEDSGDGESIMFYYPPVDLSKVVFIEPMGSMIGNHVTPIDHQYYMALDHMLQDAAQTIVDVYSPASGTVTQIQHMSSLPGDDKIQIDDYRIVIEHTSTISSIYIHLDTLSEKIAAVAPSPGEYASVNVAVGDGETIGNYSGTIDYNVVDEDIVLTGFVNPDSYIAEPWKIHTSDPFGVKSNSPDPADVSVATGQILYELVDYDYYDGDVRWDRESLVRGLKLRNSDFVQGVVLFQLTENRRLKVEIFPDTIAAGVGTFTENAMIYVR